MSEELGPDPSGVVEGLGQFNLKGPLQESQPLCGFGAVDVQRENAL